MGRIQRAMCAGMLLLQAVVVFLTTPVLLVLTDVGTVLGLVLGLGLTLACLVAAGTMRRPFGGWLGWAVQAASLLMGFLVAAMFALGLIFGSLYAGSWFLGAKIDRERRERGQGV
jgi:uncharacterized membrane protein YciS (DUF1049 family)